MSSASGPHPAPSARITTTAADSTRFAQRAADQTRNWHRHFGMWVYVAADGFWGIACAENVPSDALMRAQITESAASPDALARRLIESAVTYEHHDGECPPCTTARLADRSEDGASEALALAALLDALLAAEPA